MKKTKAIKRTAVIVLDLLKSNLKEGQPIHLCHLSCQAERSGINRSLG